MIVKIGCKVKTFLFESVRTKHLDQMNRIFFFLPRRSIKYESSSGKLLF